MKQFSCDQCRERWDELINKSTFEADPQLADVRAHLESCADCRKTFDLLIAVRQELQQLPTQKIPISLRASILSEIEKSQRQSVPWWQSFHILPQRLAWASGAIVTIFIIALLMRPDRQSQVMQTVPQELSNRSQVEEHNSEPSQVVTSPLKTKQDSTAEKVLPGNLSRKAITKSPIPKPQHSLSVESDSEEKSKPRQIQTVPAPKPALDKDKTSPEHLTDQSVQKTEPQKSATPQAQYSAAPAPIINDSVTIEKATKNASGITRPSSQESTIQSDSADHSMMRSARDPEGHGGASAMFKSQSTPPIIHWSKTITSDYDVTNAKITVTLEDGLTFVGESHKNSERTLWQGTLFRGKQIPLNIDLYRHSNEIAKIHMKMVNTDTQNILLDKTFDVK